MIFLEYKEFPIQYCRDLSLISSGGIQITGCKGARTPRKRITGELVLEKYQFVPYISDEVNFSAFN